MFWSVDRRVRLSGDDEEFPVRRTCGYQVVRAKNKEEAIAKVRELNKEIKKHWKNVWLANPLSCLNGPFLTEEGADIDYWERHPNTDLQEFDEWKRLFAQC